MSWRLNLTLLSSGEQVELTIEDADIQVQDGYVLYFKVHYNGGEVRHYYLEGIDDNDRESESLLDKLTSVMGFSATGMGTGHMIGQRWGKIGALRGVLAGGLAGGVLSTATSKLLDLFHGHGNAFQYYYYCPEQHELVFRGPVRVVA